MAQMKFDNVEKWVCTNPNVFQYCIQMDETTWIFIRPKDELLKRLKNNHCNPKTLLKDIDRQTKEGQWYVGSVDFDDYTLTEAMNYTEAYGDVNINDKERVAECIFESLMFGKPNV